MAAEIRCDSLYCYATIRDTILPYPILPYKIFYGFPLKITVQEPAASCQLSYRKFYGFLQCTMLSSHPRVYLTVCVRERGRQSSGVLLSLSLSLSLLILWTDLPLTKVASECTRSLVTMCLLQLGYFSPHQVGTHISNDFFRSRIQKFSVRLCFSKLIETENIISN